MRWPLVLIGIVWICQFSAALAQDRTVSTGSGYPFITNITPDDYDSHVQNWGFASDAQGVIYVANLTGILKFDGARWRMTNIPNVRVYSLSGSGGDRIYAGGLNEFGYLSRPDPDNLAGNSAGTYHSLRSHVPDTLDFGNVWQVEAVNDAVVFMTYSHLFRYDGEQVTIFTTDERFTSLFEMDGELYVRESYHGVKRIGSDGLELWDAGDFFREGTLQSYLEVNGKRIFCSFYECFQFTDQELVPFETEADYYLEENYIDEALALSNGTIAIATRNGGVVQLSDSGELIRILNESNGIINNTVYGLYEDSVGRLWAATVNGISKIDIHLPFRRFDHRNGITEAIIQMTFHDGAYFISSSSGVFRMYPGETAELLEAESSCGGFIEVDEYLHVVCTGAMYRYSEGRFDKITSNNFADVVAVFNNEPFENSPVILAAKDASISLVSFNQGENVTHYQINDINANYNSIEQDNYNNIWIGTEVSGLYRIRLETEGGEVVGHTVDRFFHDLENSGDNKRIHVASLGGKPSFLTWGAGIQRYDPETDSFYKETAYGDIFTEDTRQIFWAEEDDAGNIWFRTSSKYQAALTNQDGNYAIQKGVFQVLTDRQANQIFPDAFGYVWYLTDRGLVRYDPRHNFDAEQMFHTAIYEVMVRGDSLIATGTRGEPVILAYENNELRFKYAAAHYDIPESTVYRVKLEGFDSEWSLWTDEIQKDYTNIPEGTYRFLVEARNIYGTVSAASPFYLTVLPPWYRTWWAYVMYLFTTGGVLYAIYKIRLNQVLKVERIRNRIAGDLHDEISATLSSISFFAQAIEGGKIKGDKSRFVKLISKSAGEAKEKITDIVWAINPEHDEWKSFLAKCRRFTSDLLESRRISYSLKIDQHIPGKMKMQFRQHLWMIYKEMVTNVVRHSEATHVDVILNYSGGKLKLVVQDNGKGMDCDDLASEGNGLANIRKRAALIGGVAEFKTDPGMGTRWKLIVKV